MSKRIRITGPGIYGAPTKDNPTGELAIGTEFDIKGDMPVGWKGRAVVVGVEPEEGSVAILNGDDDERVTAAREEVRAEAQKFIDKLRGEHAEDLKALTERAEKAEGDLATANEQLAALTAKLAAFDRDGNGNPGGSKTDDLPGLTGKNKAELLEIAKAENVEVEEGATNADIVSAIELAREEAAKA